MLVKAGNENWPIPSSPATTNVMQANRGRDTRPEIAVRSLLHRRGLRFRTRHTIRLDGRRWTRPDVVFTRARVAVFIDGCFWHSCPEHGTEPRQNAGYWAPKLVKNVERDRDTDAQLVARGWLALRAWDHEDAAFVVDRIAAAVAARR